jgi:DNA-binding FadR family transcriptional regulator
LRVKGRLGTSYSEHQTIVDAITAGAGEAAASALRAHVAVQGERFADLMAALSQWQTSQPQPAEAASI